MQQQYQDLRKAFASGPQAGAEAWQQLQAMATQGYLPAQLFVCGQKLKSPPPLYDLQAAIQQLQALVAEDGPASKDRNTLATALHWLGEAKINHYGDELDQGFEYLGQAAQLGNVEARLSLAYCHRRGVGTAIDLQLATHWLREAAKQGHPRAFFELGMVLAQSQGSLQEALTALQRAASFNYPAAAAMADKLASNGSLPVKPSRREQLASKPAIEFITGLIDQMECAHLAALAMPQLQPSRVISDDKTGAASSGRSSEGMNFHHGLRDVVVTTVIRRLCAIAGCEFEHTEALTALMYVPGAQYRVHPDYFPIDTEAGKRQLQNGGQRIKSIVCYLNKVTAGGETEFPHLGIKVKPEPGSVVYFENADPQGQPYTDSRHAGLPVTAGTKWISTLWIRQSTHDQWL